MLVFYFFCFDELKIKAKLVCCQFLTSPLGEEIYPQG
jgi:hypothetical protein